MAIDFFRPAAMAGLTFTALFFSSPGQIPAHAEPFGSAAPVISSEAQTQPSTEKPRTSANRHSARKGSYSTARSCLPADIKARLTEIEQRWGEVKIVSTMRKGAVIAGSGRTSMHSHCRAVDFHPAPGTYKAVLGYLRDNHDGGLGTYSCAMNHLHIDNGPKIHWHHCVNKNGRPVNHKS